MSAENTNVNGPFEGQSKTIQPADGAEILARYGIRTVPANYVQRDGACSCHSPKGCANPGKHPKRPPGAPSPDECKVRGESYKSWLIYALEAPPADTLEILEWFTESYWKNGNASKRLHFMPSELNVSAIPDDRHIIVDVDRKSGKDGFKSLADRGVDVDAEAAKTLSQESPGGSVHLIYLRKTAVDSKNTVNLLSGIDLPVQVMIAGSYGMQGQYRFRNVCAPAPEPKWLTALLAEHAAAAIKKTKDKRRQKRDQAESDATGPLEPDLDSSIAAAVRYLERLPLPAEGERNKTIHLAACFLHDFGVSVEKAAEMIAKWNDDSPTPTDDSELVQTVESAYRGAQNRFGCRSPERTGKADDRNRPVVFLAKTRSTAEGSTSDQVRQIDGYLGAVPNLNLYGFGDGSLVHVQIVGEDATEGGIRLTKGTARIGKLALSQVKTVIEDNVLFKRFVATEDAFRFCDVDQEIAVRYRERGSWKRPLLRGISTTPFFRDDGSLVMRNGFDAASGIYLQLDCDVPEIPDHPTRAQAEVSLARLSGLLDEFPFFDETGRAVALALFLQSAVRKSFAQAPLIGVDGPDTKVGKSYLIECAAELSTGRGVVNVPLGGNEDENEKRLSAAYLSGLAMFNIDNLRVELDGVMLLQSLTGRVGVRRFGQNTELTEVDSQATVTATGIDLKMANEMVRRGLMCKLKRPENGHRYSHSPAEEIRANRGRYIADVLTVIRAYLAAGSPTLPVAYRPLEQCRGWHRFVRAPLLWLSIPDPVVSQDHIRRSDPVRAAVEKLTRAVYDRRGAGMARRATLANLISSAGPGEPTEPVAALLMAAKELAGNEKGDGLNINTLGRRLQTWKGRGLTNGLTLCSLEGKNGVLWWVEGEPTVDADLEAAETAFLDADLESIM